MNEESCRSWAKHAFALALSAAIAAPAFGFGTVCAQAEDIEAVNEPNAIELVSGDLADADIDCPPSSHHKHKDKDKKDDKQTQGDEEAQSDEQPQVEDQTQSDQQAANEADPAADAPAPIVYLDGNGNRQTTNDYQVLANDSTTLANGTFVVTDLTQLAGGLEVEGDATLIVGERLLIKGSIHVPAGATLRIYVMDGKAHRALVSGVRGDSLIVNEGTTYVCGASLGNEHVYYGVDNRGTLVMQGGEICGCDYAGIHNGFGATVKLLGGTIHDNKDVGFSGEGYIHVGSTPVVENNAHGDIKLDNNGHQYIMLERALKPGAHIGVKAPDKAFTMDYKKFHGPDDPAKYFFSNDGRMATWNNEGEVVFKDFSNSIEYLGIADKTCRIPAESCTDFASLGDAPKLQDGWYIVRGELTVNTRIEVEGYVHLILADGAKLTAPGGIHVCLGRSISIYCQKGKTGELVCDHKDERLEPYRDVKNEAGIGGNDNEMGSNISIYGGKIWAYGSEDAAGIGGGCDGTGGSIEIYGGEIHAYGYEYGAGIGGGRRGDGGDICIFGGSVEAHGDNVEPHWGNASTMGGGAGIGGGDSAACGNIQILGGDVWASTVYHHKDVDRNDVWLGYAAGIGGGMCSKKGGTITIRNAKVHAESWLGAGIGGGWGWVSGGYAPDLITIEGAVVEATSAQGAGIGSGKGDTLPSSEACRRVDIRRSNVTAKSNRGAGIGGGRNCDGGDVTIDRASKVNAQSEEGSNIGKGDGGDSDGTLAYVD